MTEKEKMLSKLLEQAHQDIKIWKEIYDKDTHTLQNQLDVANADRVKKDKIIDEMAKKLNQAYFDEDKFSLWFEKIMGVQQKMDYGYVVDLIKQYFEMKVRNKYV